VIRDEGIAVMMMRDGMQGHLAVGVSGLGVVVVSLGYIA